MRVESFFRADNFDASPGIGTTMTPQAVLRSQTTDCFPFRTPCPNYIKFYLFCPRCVLSSCEVQTMFCTSSPLPLSPVVYSLQYSIRNLEISVFTCRGENGQYTVRVHVYGAESVKICPFGKRKRTFLQLESSKKSEWDLITFHIFLALASAAGFVSVGGLQTMPRIRGGSWWFGQCRNICAFVV